MTFDDVYAGPYGSGDGLTLDQRRQQLMGIMHTEAGRDTVLALWYRATNTPVGQMPPVGMLHSQFVEAILSHEYPAA